MKRWLPPVILVTPAALALSWHIYYIVIPRYAYVDTTRAMYQNRAVLELYYRDHGAYPIAAPGTPLRALAKQLELGGRKVVPLDDWKNDVRYWSSPGGAHYFLISAGADGRFDYRPSRTKPAFSGSLSTDVVVNDGRFIGFVDGYSYCPQTCRNTTREHLEAQARGDESGNGEECARGAGGAWTREPAWN